MTGRSVALLLAIQIGVGSLACANAGLDLAELPSHPIALSYWDEQASQRRRDLLGDRDAVLDVPVGIAQVGDIGRMFGAREARDLAEQLSRIPSSLVLLDPQTREITRVAAAPHGSRPLAWSPDRKRLLFASAKKGRNLQILELDFESGFVRSVSFGSRSHEFAAYGPDDRIAYFAWERIEGEYEAAVYVTEPGGARAAPAFRGETLEDLNWTPNGESLVYTRLGQRSRKTGDVSREVVRRSLAGDDTVRAMGRGRSVTLTPDGEWIVYSAPIRDGGWRLRRMRVDGSGRTGLGHETLRDELDPTVSPDGRFVAYAGEDGGTYRLFVRRFDGTGDRILLTSGEVASPVW